MGKKGGKDDRVHHCIAIEPKIMEKMSSGMLGNLLPEKQHNSDEDDDDVSWEAGTDDEEDYVDYGYSPGKAPPSDVEDGLMIVLTAQMMSQQMMTLGNIWLKLENI